MKKIIKILLIIFTCVLLLIFGAIYFINSITQRPEITDSPKISKWYRITPEGSISADGTQSHGLIKIGKENKVLVYFYGGGVSVDEYSQSKPEVFYTNAVKHDGIEGLGIGSDSENNPYRDWTMLVLPYSTGDFHIGTGEFNYTDSEGNQKTGYHHGYTNYKLFMDKAMQYIDTPDSVMITGFSAGGFGASLLADDVLTNYFPTVDNSTVLVDGALLLNNNWQDISSNLWKAPKEISSKLVSDNIVLDSLKSLSESHPNTKILFESSTRDGALTLYQNYIVNGVMQTSEEMGEIFQSNLKSMVNEIQKLPNTAVFIWDGIPYTDDNDKGLKENTTLTQHTVLMFGFTDISIEGTSIAEWSMDAVNGKLKNYGLDTLNKSY